jgi:hypothetical protein
MVGDRPLREHQPVGDIPVAQPFDHQPQHFQLAGRQAGRILPRRGTWSSPQRGVAAPPRPRPQARAPPRTGSRSPSTPRPLLANPRRSSATASSGPSGRGVKSGSHAPQRMRADSPHSSHSRRRSAVLPTPASPPTRTKRPRPLCCTASRDSPSVASAPARSSSPLEASETAAGANLCTPPIVNREHLRFNPLRH